MYFVYTNAFLFTQTPLFLSCTFQDCQVSPVQKLRNLAFLTNVAENERMISFVRFKPGYFPEISKCLIFFFWIDDQCKPCARSMLMFQSPAPRSRARRTAVKLDTLWTSRAVRPAAATCPLPLSPSYLVSLHCLRPSERKLVKLFFMFYTVFQENRAPY